MTLGCGRRPDFFRTSRPIQSFSFFFGCSLKCWSLRRRQRHELIIHSLLSHTLFVLFFPLQCQFHHVLLLILFLLSFDQFVGLALHIKLFLLFMIFVYFFEAMLLLFIVMLLMMMIVVLVLVLMVVTVIMMMIMIMVAMVMLVVMCTTMLHFIMFILLFLLFTRIHQKVFHIVERFSSWLGNLVFQSNVVIAALAGQTGNHLDFTRALSAASLHAIYLNLLVG